MLIACSEAEKPVEEVLATAITLNKKDIVLEKGANEVLTVTFTPSNTTNKSLTWVSSNKSIAEVTDGIVVGVDAGNTEIIVKNGDLTDKCAVTVVVSAKSITLNKDSIELEVGSSETLTATVEPSNSTDKLEWSSSAEDIASVKDGTVTAIAPGTASITAKAGSQTAMCEVVVKKPFKIEAVDLGLSVKWANANLGATSPEGYGDYYAWGEIEPKEVYSWETYKWCNGVYNELTKYNSDSSYGAVDNKTVLEAADDVAHVKLGGEWRTPTRSEVDELIATRRNPSYQWEWRSLNGHNGWFVTYLVNNNSIFFPAAGLLSGTSDYDTVGAYGIYMSSSLDTDSPHIAWCLYFYSSNAIGNFFDRFVGRSVRPVFSE